LLFNQQQMAGIQIEPMKEGDIVTEPIQTPPHTHVLPNPPASYWPLVGGFIVENAPLLWIMIITIILLFYFKIPKKIKGVIIDFLYRTPHLGQDREAYINRNLKLARLKQQNNFADTAKQADKVTKQMNAHKFLEKTKKYSDTWKGDSKPGPLSGITSKGGGYRPSNAMRNQYHS